MSQLKVNAIRHTGASTDAITMDSSGNVTFPANATCSGTASGFGGGKVVKHAFQSYDTQGNTTSSSFQDTGLSISYTPVAANNLIYCIAMQQCYIWNNGGGDGRAQYNLLQGSTQIALSQFECSGTNSLESVGNEILMGRFTAANTNAVTVKTQYRRVSAGGQAAAYAQHGSRASTLTIIEVEP
jgi:hypothetical protein